MFLKSKMSFLGVLLAVTGHAATVELRCPETLVTTEKLEKTPSGFTSRTAEAKHYWEAVDFYSGKPEENASLAPTGRLWQFSKKG